MSFVKNLAQVRVSGFGDQVRWKEDGRLDSISDRLMTAIMIGSAPRIGVTTRCSFTLVEVKCSCIIENIFSDDQVLRSSSKAKIADGKQALHR